MKTEPIAPLYLVNSESEHDVKIDKGYKMKRFAIIMGIIASALCLTAGIWILVRTGLGPGENDDDTIFIWQGMAIYFIAKAFFVGPMLILTATQNKD